MSRTNGYIDLETLLNIHADSFEKLALSVKNNPQIEVIHSSLNPMQLAFLFEYNGQKYFFKYDEFAESYNELLAEEIAKDLGVPCIDYDLACIGKFKGVISPNYKKENAKYLKGFDILYKIYRYYTTSRNSLHDIWLALEEYYQYDENVSVIVPKLMEQVVNMFVFDALTAQEDRHFNNWEIVEDGEDIYLQPLFDNGRMLSTKSEFIEPMFYVENQDFASSLSYNVLKFQRESSSEFSKILPNSLWVIEKDNLEKIFKRIEKKTKYEMPKELKEELLIKFQRHLEFLKSLLEILNIPSKSSRS